MASKVLLIDDSRQIHDLVRSRLLPESVSLHCAADGKEGLSMALQLEPDLILLDIEMPGMDGFEVCRRLKDNSITADIPVLLLTGSASARQKYLEFDYGAVDFIPKPFDGVELRARVRATLRLKHASEMLTARAQIDSLTGLWNRRYFLDRLEQEMSLSCRTGQPVCCIKIKIEQLKMLRDTHGVLFSDRVVQEIGKALGSVARTHETVCRLNVDEFAMICPNTTLTGARTLGSRCLAAITLLALRHGDRPIAVACRLYVAGEQRDTTALLGLLDGVIDSSQIASTLSAVEKAPIPIAKSA